MKVKWIVTQPGVFEVNKSRRFFFFIMIHFFLFLLEGGIDCFLIFKTFKKITIEIEYDSDNNE